jgi:hypothetical protein
MTQQEQTTPDDINITPDINAVVWVTDVPLSQIPRYFYQIDYYFGGLLVDVISGQKQHTSSHEEKNYSLFKTKNFGRDIFLGHFQSNNSKLKDQMASFLKLVRSRAKEGENILIISKKGVKTIKHSEKNTVSLA